MAEQDEDTPDPPDDLPDPDDEILDVEVEVDPGPPPLTPEEEAAEYADREEWRADDHDYENPTTGYETDYVKHAPLKGAEPLQPTTDKLTTVKILTLPAENVPWLWEGYIALGSVTILEGDPGLGKTFVLLDVMARLSRGEAMPFAEAPLLPPSASIIASAEDNVNYVLKPRLLAAGATEEAEIYTFTQMFTLPNDIAAVTAEVKARKARFVVVDPGFAYWGSLDPYSDVQARKVLSALTQLASGQECAVVFVRHLNKNVLNPNAKHRGGGSIAITAASRSELVVTPVKRKKGEGPAAVRLAQEKPNLGPTAMTLTYTLEPVTVQDGATVIQSARVKWLKQLPPTTSETQEQEVQEPKPLSEALTEAAKRLGVASAEALRKEVGARAKTVKEALDELVENQVLVIEWEETGKRGPKLKLYRAVDPLTGGRGVRRRTSTRTWMGRRRTTNREIN